MGASQSRASSLESTTKSAPAKCAAPHSPSTATTRSGAAPDRVLSVCEAGTADVYDLTVEHQHEFFANGVAVHNSDAIGYFIGYEWPIDVTATRIYDLN